MKSVGSNQPFPSNRRGDLLALLLSSLCALVIAYIAIKDAPDFCLDDAWIHLDYALSLRLNEGLSYNPNDFETGFSSPLWVLLLALLPIL